MGDVRRLIKPLIALFVILVVLTVGFYHLEKKEHEVQQELFVLSYPNFIKDWGPGPQIAKNFEKEYGIRIRWVEATNAGMIIDYLTNNNQYPIDVVLGLDILSLERAQRELKWKKISPPRKLFVSDITKVAAVDHFVPFDWSPMTFVYKRKGELPPRSLRDLATEGFINSLGLQDPTSSSTGMYFLIWILSVMGEEQGYAYLAQLKPSIRVISPSWSAGYSLFQNDQVPYIFSYFTSPLYHHIQEKNFSYQPIFFDEPHIYSIEYGGVPETCRECPLAKKFLLFLLRAENQKLIMTKNFMLPVVKGIKDKTEFDLPQSMKLVDPKSFNDLMSRKEDLLKKWRDLRL